MSKLLPYWTEIWTPAEIEAEVKECNANRQKILHDLEAAGIAFTIREDDWVDQLTLSVHRPGKPDKWIQIRPLSSPRVDDGMTVHLTNDVIGTIQRILSTS